jgi:hypothetical protein
MAGAVRFNIAVFVENGDLFPELMGRSKDLRPAFDMIIKKWAKGNADKFAKGAGAEMVGASIDPAVYWQQLKPSTMIQKRREGFNDHIMVRTGSLMASLSDPEGFFQAMTAEEAVFGTPTSPEDEDKVKYNYEKRQTLFFSNDDKRMIEATVKHYFELGEDFEQIMFGRELSIQHSQSPTKSTSAATRCWT